MKVITYVWTHYPKALSLFHYYWHKDKVENLRVFSNNTVIDHEDFINVTYTRDQVFYKGNEFMHQLFIEHDNINADYYMFVENDAFLLRSGFDLLCAEYMKAKGVDFLPCQLACLADYKRNEKNQIVMSDCIIPYSENTPSGTNTLITIGSLLVISKKAAKDYVKAYKNKKESEKMWNECDLPTTLVKMGYKIAKNPYLNDLYFHWIYTPDVTVRHTSLGMSHRVNDIKKIFDVPSTGQFLSGAIHPLKDYHRLLPFYTEGQGLPYAFRFKNVIIISNNLKTIFKYEKDIRKIIGTGLFTVFINANLYIYLKSAGIQFDYIFDDAYSLLNYCYYSKCKNVFTIGVKKNDSYSINYLDNEQDIKGFIEYLKENQDKFK